MRKEHARLSPGRNRLALVLAGAAALGLTLQLAAKPLASAGALAPVQHYVALDFPHPRDLPGQVTGGRSLLAFEFQIINEEARATDITWVARLLPTGERSYRLGTGRADVAAEGSALVYVAARAHGHWSTATVEVSALGSGEAALEFHVTNVMGSGAG